AHRKQTNTLCSYERSIHIADLIDPWKFKLYSSFFVLSQVSTEKLLILEVNFAYSYFADSVYHWMKSKLCNDKMKAFSTNGSDITISACRKMKMEPYLPSCTKLKSKWIKDINIGTSSKTFIQYDLVKGLEYLPPVDGSIWDVSFQQPSPTICYLLHPSHHHGLSYSVIQMMFSYIYASTVMVLYCTMQEKSVVPWENALHSGCDQYHVLYYTFQRMESSMGILHTGSPDSSGTP
ncbi:hypothetical protein STEG23_020597, partial [Scotinomys teguina]